MGLGNVVTDKARDKTGYSKGGSNDGKTKSCLPDFGPGCFDFFGVAIGGDKAVAAHDNLDESKDAGNGGG